MAEPKMLLDKSFNDLEYARMVGTIKRVLEKWTLDAAFHDAYLQDPDRALAETGLDVDPETISLLLNDDAAKEMTNALEKGELAWDDLPDGYRFYKAFVKEKIAYAELVNRCWEDPEYLAKFKEDPISALEEFRIPTKSGATYHVVSLNDIKPSTEEDIYLPFQEKPGLQSMGDDMLDNVAGGGFMIKNSNLIANANVVAQNDIAGYSEAIAATISVEVAYG